MNKQLLSLDSASSENKDKFFSYTRKSSGNVRLVWLLLTLSHVNWSSTDMNIFFPWWWKIFWWECIRLISELKKINRDQSEREKKCFRIRWCCFSNQTWNLDKEMIYDFQLLLNRRREKTFIWPDSGSREGKKLMSRLSGTAGNAPEINYFLQKYKIKLKPQLPSRCAHFWFTVSPFQGIKR